MLKQLPVMCVFFLYSCANSDDGGGANAKDCMAQSKFVYQVRGGGSFVAYDFVNRRFWMSPKPDIVAETDLGGPIQDCSNDEITCFSGGMTVMLPHDRRKKSWSVGPLVCNSQYKNELQLVSCKSGNAYFSNYSLNNNDEIVEYFHKDQISQFGPFVLYGKCGIPMSNHKKSMR